MTKISEEAGMTDQPNQKPIGRYGCAIQWGGNRATIFGEDTPEIAREKCIKLARKCGWPGPPKWWQFWRRGDTKP